jgi:hypothetical protein
MAVRVAVATGMLSCKDMTLVSCCTKTQQPTHTLQGRNSTIACRFESFFVMVGGPGKNTALDIWYFEWCSSRICGN